jgi:hypothetical protein
MKVKKAQVGKAVAKKKAAVDSVESEMFPGKMIPKSKSNYATGKIAKMVESGKPKASKAAPVKKKMKSGGSLKPVDSSKNPGLAKLPTEVRNKMGYQKNGGKLKAKSGAALKKQAAKAVAMKKAGKSPKKAMGGMKMMMGGGKCKYGC